MKIHGFGVNDADYPIKRKKGGKTVWTCPFYTAWSNMIYRAYSGRHKAYNNISVCDDWRSFMAFKKWMKGQDWEGKSLDKDIIEPGSKTYSPDTCCFIPQSINTLIINKGRKNTGVYFDSVNKKYKAQCSVNGKTKSLGRYKTEEEALSVYRSFKAELIRSQAKNETDDRVVKGLMRHAALIEMVL